MNILLNELHSYHHDMASKISQIRELLKKLKLQAIDDEDGKLLFEMLEALHGDAERHHHENEELVRRALLTTEAPIHRRILDIERDHQAFGRIAEQLRMLPGTTKDPKVIADTVDDFIGKYFDHMESEENIFFPAADKWLSDSQWLEIKHQWH